MMALQQQKKRIGGGVLQNNSHLVLSGKTPS